MLSCFASIQLHTSSFGKSFLHAPLHIRKDGQHIAYDSQFLLRFKSFCASAGVTTSNVTQSLTVPWDCTTLQPTTVQAQYWHNTECHVKSISSRVHWWPAFVSQSHAEIDKVAKWSWLRYTTKIRINTKGRNTRSWHRFATITLCHIWPSVVQAEFIPAFAAFVSWPIHQSSNLSSTAWASVRSFCTFFRL